MTLLMLIFDYLMLTMIINIQLMIKHFKYHISKLNKLFLL